jgi:AraC-like DNA-binding protein
MSPYNQVPTITIGEDVATLVGRDSRQLGRARDVITAFDIASGWRFLTILIGGKLPTREIEIPLPQSPSANELKKIFGVVPKFSRASQSRFVFDASCMRVPLMLADAELSAAHAEACALVADRTPNGSPVAQAVRDYLVRYQHSNPRARDVSRALATSERTLRRRLLEEGLSYSQLLEDVKRALACEMLSNTPLSITQISERVGFGESSNFSLAFKRWTGVTPRAFRARATDKST